MLQPNVVLVDYGWHSETERMLVSDEGLAIQSLLKIQSGPLGNLWDQPFDGDKFILSSTGSVKSVILPSKSTFKKGGAKFNKKIIKIIKIIKIYVLAPPFLKVDLRHIQTDGKSLRAFATTCLWKHLQGSQLIAEPDGKKVKDWVIRSQVPNLVMVRVWERFND